MAASKRYRHPSRHFKHLVRDDLAPSSPERCVKAEVAPEARLPHLVAMAWLTELPQAGALAAFFQVVMIDLALAGDNAVAVGLAASGLPPAQRRRAIVLGLLAAVVMLIGFALVTVQLLKVVGLLLGGGALLLWVCWKMWRELRRQGRAETAEGEAALAAATGVAIGSGPVRSAKAKTMGQALLQILAADLAMSLDNVLAVAGAARQHPQVLVAGLLLSITLTGIAASWIARLLHRARWLGYLGLAIVFYVSLHMMWQGHRAMVIDMGRTADYNAGVPAAMAITPAEVAERKQGPS